MGTWSNSEYGLSFNFTEAGVIDMGSYQAQIQNYESIKNNEVNEVQASGTFDLSSLNPAYASLTLTFKFTSANNCEATASDGTVINFTK